MSDKVPTPNPQEQYLLLAKTAKGPAAVQLIKQILEAPGVFVFGEFLDAPNIIELQHGDHRPYLELLKIFAFGTFADYKSQMSELPSLTHLQQTKLRHLTLVSLATKSKCIPYPVLQEELDIPNVRELEDMIIEAIYSDILLGKLDQKNGQLEVDYAVGRDVRGTDVSAILTILDEWCATCDAVLSSIHTQITQANKAKDCTIRHRVHVDQEVQNIRKTLKAQSADSEEAVSSDSREAISQSDKAKKQPKTKPLRGSTSKFWQKS